MAEAAVETPTPNSAPHKRPALSDAIVPAIENLEGSGSDSGDDYATLKRLERQLEYVDRP